MKVLQDAIAGYYEGNVDRFPTCFNSLAEYKEWLRLEVDAPTEPRRFPCRDCTVEYQRRMVGEGRCRIAKVSVEKIAR